MLKSTVFKVKSLLIVLSFLMFFNSCKFTPTGTNFVDIKQQEPVASINLNYAKDTIKVWGNIYLNYQINIGNLKVDPSLPILVRQK